VDVASQPQTLRVFATGEECATVLARVAAASAAPLFELSSFESADKLLQRLAHGESPDLILLDADCPRTRALELCRTLKEQVTTLLLPVILVSRSTRDRVAAFAAGADDFMTLRAARELCVTRLQALARAGCARRHAAATALDAEKLRREEIRQTFRRYVSPRLADRILGDDPLCVPGEQRTRAVVMFADLRGFTGISERLSPQEVVPLLNEYFSLLTAITFAYEGTVFHMAGDCLMVGFGVPLMQSDSPERAVRTAQEMLQQFTALADSWRRRHQIETGLGIGINEGDVVAGNVGSTMFMNYTIIGDAVNIASRLCQRARAGEMVFSRSIKHALDARGLDVHARELPPMTLRGRTSPVDIFCVPLARRLDLGEVASTALAS